MLLKEILLYSKLLRIPYKKKSNKSFVDNLEKEHPEIKNAIVKGMLDLI